MNNVGDSVQELVNFDVLGQNLEEVLADVVLAGCLDQACSRVHILACRATLIAIRLLVIFVWALTSCNRLDLLCVHVEGWIILDDAQSTCQVHEFECLSTPVVHLLAPVVEPCWLSKVWPMKQVHLLFHRLHLSCLLKFL